MTDYQLITISPLESRHTALSVQMGLSILISINSMESMIESLIKTVALNPVSVIESWSFPCNLFLGIAENMLATNIAV